VKVIISALMGPGTLEAKVEPIAQVESISNIIFIRKHTGSALPKLTYVLLPKFLNNKILSIISIPALLVRETIRQKPDLLIGYHIIPYAFYVALAGLITKTPYIVSQTGLQIQQKTGNWLFRNLLKPVFKHAVQINCPGTCSVAFWQNRFPKLAYKFKILHSTVDINYFVPDNSISKTYDFIFMGRLAPIKNIDIILHALHILFSSGYKKFKPKMVIVGDGPERDNLTTIMKNLNLNGSVHFTGFADDPLPWLQQSRFIVMASVTEGLPTAMMQAMACEVIPITNLAGNIPDLVADNETGFTFQHISSEEIADTMKRALSADNELLRTMKTKAKEVIIKHHSHESAKIQWNEIFSLLTANRIK
jgi:glycosyltransferase involved in cell wall biosynthesis